jgi:hypothetical protein
VAAVLFGAYSTLSRALTACPRLTADPRSFTGAVNAVTFTLMFAWAVQAYRNFGKGLYEKGVSAACRWRIRPVGTRCDEWHAHRPSAAHGFS